MLLGMVSIRGQSLEDKLNAVKYFISGQGLSFVILKATTSELIGPKKKHLNYLTSITHEPNVSIPNLVKYLMQRARHQEWSIVFKSLMTIHYLISYGNEKFIQNLASSTANQKTFDHLASFSDRSSNQAYDMSTFIRRYARYLSAKICSYKSLGIDFCRTPKVAINLNNNSSNKHSGTTIKTTNATSTSNGLLITTTSLRQEPPPTVINNVDYICSKQQQQESASSSPLKMKTIQCEQLLTTLPILQNLFDSLMAFDACVKDLNNGIINSVFSMLYKDFVKLYIAYQTAIIRLLELFSRCKQLKQAHEMLEAYKKFLVRMDKVSDFMFVVDSVGMDKSDMPNVSRAPNVSLKILERHLDNLTSYSSLRRNNTQQQLLGKQATQGGTHLSRGQSVELPPPKIEYDYGTYGRRRTSFRRSTTATATSTTLTPSSSSNNSIILPLLPPPPPAAMTTSTPIKPTEAVTGKANDKKSKSDLNSTRFRYKDFATKSHYYTTIEDPLGEEEDVDLLSYSDAKEKIDGEDVMVRMKTTKKDKNGTEQDNIDNNKTASSISEAMKSFDQQSLLLLMGDEQDSNVINTTTTTTTGYENSACTNDIYNETIIIDKKDNSSIVLNGNNNNNNNKTFEQHETDIDNNSDNKRKQQKSENNILGETSNSSFLVASRLTDWVKVDL